MENEVEFGHDELMVRKSSRSAGSSAKPWATQLGDTLRTRRKLLRLTQQELSALAGCGPDFLYDLERGKPSIRLDKLILVLEVLGLELKVGARAPRRLTDPRSVEQLDVFRNTERVGTLRRTSHGASFEYDTAFFEAHRRLPGGVATSIPYAKRAIETTGVNLPTYFAGLLPEGLWLKALHQRVKNSEDDLFSLLVAAGADTVGDLFPIFPGETPQLDEGALSSSWLRSRSANSSRRVSGPRPSQRCQEFSRSSLPA